MDDYLDKRKPVKRRKERKYQAKKNNTLLALTEQ
jgi:hypothetical protein